jgi:hypothetical protein
MTFDAQKEAEKIEHLAKERMDTPADKAQGASDALLKEWSSLTLFQRADVELAITKKYEFSLDTMPSPTVEFNLRGQPIGLYFTAAKGDFHHGPHTLELISGEPANGKEMTYLKADCKPSDPVHQEAEKIYDLVVKKMDTPLDADSKINRAILEEWDKASPVQELVAWALEETASNSGTHIHAQASSEMSDKSIGVVFTHDSSKKYNGPVSVGLGTVNYDGDRAEAITANNGRAYDSETVRGLDSTKAQKFFSDVHDGSFKLSF